MATYPNNYRTGVGFLPNYTFFGIMGFYTYNAELGTGAGSRLNWMVGSAGGFARTSSAPGGYGIETPFPPIKAGGMSAWNDPVADIQMTGNLLNGGAMQSSSSVLILSPGGDLSMIITMDGTSAVVSMVGESMVLRLTVGLDGSGTFTLTGDNNLAMTVPFDGAGSVVTMGPGSTDLRELLSLSGQWTPFTELSPENLARNVWEALATQFNNAGTMGNLLNLAGSGGVDYNLLAQAIMTAAQVTPIHSDVRKVNSHTITGAGESPSFDANGVMTDPGDPWRPA